MEFSHLGNKVLLYGLSPTELTVDEGNKFFRPSISENRAVVLKLLSQSDVLPSKTENEVIFKLLEVFKNVFDEPKGLSPPRSHDHQILLKEGTQPICVRPYRYPYYQKTEIEKIVRYLLESGVIKPSQSPFSSPVLLVRKAAVVRECALIIGQLISRQLRISSLFQ